LLINV